MTPGGLVIQVEFLLLQPFGVEESTCYQSCYGEIQLALGLDRCGWKLASHAFF